MDEQTLRTLEYGDIIAEASRYAVSYEGRRRISELQPMSKLSQIARSLEETEEAKRLLSKGASVPLPSLEGVETVVSLLGSGYMFGEQDLTSVGVFLHSCTQLKKYMAGKREIAPGIASFAASLEDLPGLQSEILRCIRHGRVTNEASRELEKVRRKMEQVKERIQKRMQSIMSRYSGILQEQLVSVRAGRYVIPVRKEFYKQVKGRVHDQSTSGQTVFVEPEEISALQSELEGLSAEEGREEAKVLSALSERVEASASELKLNIDITGTYDFLFAKAKYAVSIGGEHVQVNDTGVTRMLEARHPKLLERMVPLDLELSAAARIMIITGPNTGGKTVVLKTLGLLTLMVQSGLLVPVRAGSCFAVFENIRAVVGDGQSLEQSLSTFSAQMASLVQMLNTADSRSLMLIDELAAGTDPGEGMALSVAILEELSQRQAAVLVTTHFNELKTFAAQTPGFVNARMEFDPVSLRPLYQLTIGEAGQSYALEIAQRLGMSQHVIERSRKWMTGRMVKETAPQNSPSAVPEPPVELEQGEKEAGQRADKGCQEEEVKTSVSLASNIEHSRDPAPASTRQESRHPVKGEDQKEERTAAKKGYEPGDAVWVTSLNRPGIVIEPQDHRGTLLVMIQKQQIRVNHKRIKPYISKKELYPDDYDLDIVFESKENRKKKKQMSKHHMEGMQIVKPSEDRSK
ncbi:DNA mismatch repair protein MutS [Paenibacillus sp. CAA11]|uniref:endonuclease MutS2 n=1 Tax=Paenibacillus sp. CAA11 TaxID=1532905 RepID=UPI000D3B5578|nr:DNA mismatch repair protein MutS [Paenibacillus sp. CAA11]AWB43322.1 DNA mismatch repair protein MutS [Paenibacillus sp. CAA11]